MPPTEGTKSFRLFCCLTARVLKYLTAMVGSQCMQHHTTVIQVSSKHSSQVEQRYALQRQNGTITTSNLRASTPETHGQGILSTLLPCVATSQLFVSCCNTGLMSKPAL